ncbi:hypothetical protein FB45DRAFT_1055125, partial [Roridomyces roridus]
PLLSNSWLFHCSTPLSPLAQVSSLSLSSLLFKVLRDGTGRYAQGSQESQDDRPQKHRRSARPPHVNQRLPRPQLLVKSASDQERWLSAKSENIRSRRTCYYENSHLLVWFAKSRTK